MLLTAAISLVAGALSVLAPCVLPFLPIIVGGSVHGASKARPWIITASLIVSLVAFTIVLKATAIAAHLDPAIWTFVSGGLVIVLGVGMLFPGAWTWVSLRLGLNRSSHVLLDKASAQRNRWMQSVLTGAALGPVLTSCSPTYAWVIATVLPASAARGTVLLSLYCVGLAFALLAISLLGRTLINRIRWAAHPNGWFQRSIAVMFLIVGIAIVFGWDQKAERAVEAAAPGLTRIEQNLLPGPAVAGGQGAEQPGAQPGGQPAAGGESVLSTNYPAPELRGIEQWLNSAPTHLAELRGKVVLIDFWTYSCVNCQRTQPYLNSWYDTYHEQGLEIIGVHAPEFAFEKNPANVEQAIRDANIRYRVALDNNFSTWNAYNNRYWPAKYLIDPAGNVRYVHFGEGDYEGTEAAITELLGLGAPSAQHTPSEPGPAPRAYPITAETYLGTDRARSVHANPPLHNGPGTYAATAELPADSWTLGGQWSASGQAITATADDAMVELHFRGREVNIVLDGPTGAQVQVQVVDAAGMPVAATPAKDVRAGRVTLDGARMYNLVDGTAPVDGARLHLVFPAGVSAHSFTFG